MKVSLGTLIDLSKKIRLLFIYFQWSWKSTNLKTRFGSIPGFPLKCTHSQSGFQGP